jgi:hypothetical protein
MLGDLDWLAFLLVVWLGFLAVLLRMRRRHGIRGAGLVYSYLLHMGVLHWFSASIYLLPWFRGANREAVVLGFEQALYGLGGFVLGSLLLHAVRGPELPPMTGQTAPLAAAGRDPDLPLYYIGAGLLAYATVLTPFGAWATVRALIATSQLLIVIGLCLLCWYAWREGQRGKVMGLLAATLLLPLATIVRSGHLGQGAVAALVVLVFAMSFYQPRRKLMAAVILIGYLGLSFYVSYMRDRGEIREAVWGGRPLGERIEELTETILTTELFDPTSHAHLAPIDLRLNQNLFVGVAVDRLRFAGDFAYGETVLVALSAAIPRVIWPDRPAAAGSGDLVSRYTGFRFAEGTSVGIGQVMEFYVNFGTPGVVLGFVLFGFALTFLDTRARRALDEEQIKGFAFWYLIGLALLNVGGSLTEVVGTAASAVAAGLLVNLGYDHLGVRRGTPLAAGRRASWSA